MADGKSLTEFVSLTSLFRDANLPPDRVGLMPQRLGQPQKEVEFVPNVVKNAKLYMHTE
jgi:hypothetical protein